MLTAYLSWLACLLPKVAPTPGTDALKRGTAKLAEPLSPEEHQQYRKLVGQLLWLSNLRVDIMYAIKKLSRGLASPPTDHWAKLKQLLRYLRGTKDYVQELCPKLRLSEKHSSLDVHTCVDSDCAGNPARVGRLPASPRTCWV